ncbi:protein kinase, ATP binding site-containing protein [Tanacetum coccineum]
MSVTTAVNYSAIEVKGNIGQTKVKRYWPGKAPDWAVDHVGTDHEDNNYIHMLGSVYDRRLSRLRKNYEGIVSNVKEEKMEVEIWVVLVDLQRNFSAHLQYAQLQSKRHKRDVYHGKNEFLNQLKLLITFQHENIVPFIGYCDEDDEMITALHEVLNSLHKVLGEDKFPETSQESMKRLLRVSGITWIPFYLESGHPKGKLMCTRLDSFSLNYGPGCWLIIQKEFGDAKPQTNVKFGPAFYYDDGLDKLIDPFIRDQIVRRSLLTFEEMAYKCISFNTKDRPTMDKIIKTIEDALFIQVSLFI